MKMRNTVIPLLAILAVAAGIWGVSAVRAKEDLVALQDLPSEVRATIEKYADGGTINEVEREERGGEIFYEAEVILNGKEMDILVSATGKYIKTDIEDDEDDDDDDGDDDDHEQVIGWNDLPAAVRAQLDGAEPVEITAESDDGAVTYEVEYLDNGTEVSVTFAEAGDIIETEEVIAADDLPDAVLARLERSFPNGVIEEAERVVVTFYEIELKTGRGERELKVFANGQPLDDDEDDDEDDD